MVFGLAAPAIDILVELRELLRLLRLVTTKRVSGPSAPASNASDDPLDPAPALRAVEELHETAKLAIRGAASIRLRAGFETFDMAAQCRARRMPRM